MSASLPGGRDTELEVKTISAAASFAQPRLKGTSRPRNFSPGADPQAQQTLWQATAERVAAFNREEIKAP